MKYSEEREIERERERYVADYRGVCFSSSFW